jgi:hypothetical protein
MAGLTDAKNNLPKLKKRNGKTHSTNVLQLLLAVLVGMMFFLMLAGCKANKLVVEKETIYKETFKDTTIYLPGEIVTQHLSDDFLNDLKMRFKSDLKDTIRITSRTGMAELQIFTDQFGQLVAACEAKDREIEALVKTIEKFDSHKEKEVITVTKVPVWAWWLLVIFASIVIVYATQFLKIINNGKK